jgi:hypothetical protein
MIRTVYKRPAVKLVFCNFKKVALLNRKFFYYSVRNNYHFANQYFCNNEYQRSIMEGRFI